MKAQASTNSKANKNNFTKTIAALLFLLVAVQAVNAAAINDLDFQVKGDESVLLSWSAISDINFYKIYRSTSSITEENKTASRIFQTQNNYFQDYTVRQNTVYYYRVSAVKDVNGDSNESLLGNEVRVEVPGFVSVKTDFNTIALVPETSVGIILELKNNSGTEQTIKLDADTGNPKLKAELATEEITLNDGESTEIALQITAEKDIPEGRLEVQAQLEYNDGLEKNLNFEVWVRKDYFVEFDFNDEIEFCNSEFTGEIAASVRNQTGKTLEFKLEASSEQFLPFFEDSEVELAQGESIDRNVTINISGEDEGTYSIQLMALAEDAGIIQVGKLEFKLLDCEAPSKESFSFSIPSTCFALDKNKSKEISYTLSNTSSNDFYVDIEVQSELAAEHDLREFLQAGKTIKGSIKVISFITSAVKKQDVKVIASSADFTKSFTACIDLKATRIFDFNISKKGFAVMQGASKTVELEFANGDYTEEFTLSTALKPENVRIEFSEPSFSIEPRKTKKIALTVFAEANAEAGEHSARIKARTDSGMQKELEFNFFISESQIVLENVLKIESYPVEIQLNPASEKELYFAVFNSSSEKIENLKVELLGLPDGVSFNRITVPEIQGLQGVIVKGTINASENAVEDNFDLTLKVSSGSFETRREIPLIIGEKQEGLLSGLMAGFASLAGSVWLGVIALIIIIAVLIIASAIARSGKPEKPKEPWMREPQKWENY